MERQRQASAQIAGPTRHPEEVLQPGAHGRRLSLGVFDAQLAPRGQSHFLRREMVELRRSERGEHVELRSSRSDVRPRARSASVRAPARRRASRSSIRDSVRRPGRSAPSAGRADRDRGSPPRARAGRASHPQAPARRAGAASPRAPAGRRAGGRGPRRVRASLPRRAAPLRASSRDADPGASRVDRARHPHITRERPPSRRSSASTATRSSASRTALSAESCAAPPEASRTSLRGGGRPDREIRPVRRSGSRRRGSPPSPGAARGAGAASAPAGGAGSFANPSDRADRSRRKGRWPPDRAPAAFVQKGGHGASVGS